MAKTLVYSLSLSLLAPYIFNAFTYLEHMGPENCCLVKLSLNCTNGDKMTFLFQM